MNNINFSYRNLETRMHESRRRRCVTVSMGIVGDMVPWTSYRTLPELMAILN